MGNPVLVEVTRGTVVESRHAGAVAVVDTTGRVVLSLGDVERPVFPRSAVKAIQALPLIESGAADRFGFGAEELALACASHSGEPGHVETAERMLRSASLDVSALKCGAHWPLNSEASRALVRSGGTATAIHNNCSGKHAGFICACCAIGADVGSYHEPEHPVQREVKAALESFSGIALSDHVQATDGCSVPTWAMPLSALARAFAVIATGAGLGPERAKAMARLRGAVAEKPWHVAGTGRFCTEIMRAFGSRIFIKTGAEGVYCAALPDQGWGIAVKCDDGAGRAAEVMVAATLAWLLPEPVDRVALQPFVVPTLRNWRGIEVGRVQPAGPLAL
jgi:L-asparaginase II